MSAIQRRVLHGSKQCALIFWVLAKRDIATIEIPIRVRKRCPKQTLASDDVWSVMTAAYRTFYHGTELADCLSSMTVAIDVAARTVILKNIRLAHKVKHLPKKLHDIRVY
jgi:hypothetical protein